jgi:hypothetical protein
MFSGIDLHNVRDTARLLLGILTLAANCLLVPALASSELVIFASFALFEVCVGLYFPAMGRLKSELVDDAVRARVYGLMRLPLNIFVVLALGLTQEGTTCRVSNVSIYLLHMLTRVQERRTATSSLLSRGYFCSGHFLLCRDT